MTVIDPQKFSDLRRPKASFSPQQKVVAALLTLVGVWGFAIATLGVPALVYPMMVIVPALVVMLVLITWGM